ncbi:PREDICTED: SWR1 complex bromodomain subunit bdf1 [Theobroma cacao]|uniref:SWR1 complex bromodomain subunit bdf1 n=1 Tax=Theobroma cacao TaxID=3641 RepID=A0AB32VVG1_THECC|nr:PREDICTED: SWR1 complex bromodomain subunit bdf1 [Theobroma cacao]XP_007041234.2 PREDICTED: SWR1 complex bromodomain subunit bdf1 [Theobroma cacao]XP_017971778.1 PREDICTED: SWR1 complex bromodomain subunit bdf1 [Theobroma cacao]
MKRKRGHKKGNKAKANAAAAVNEAAVNVVSVNSEENSVNDEYESGMEVDTPSSTGTDQALHVASINPDGSIDKAIGKPVGRVKVKLKTSSKALESDVPSHSDTDKSSPQVGLERPGVVNEKMEDSANSSAEVKMGVSSGASRKAGSIKIKPSRVLGSSNVDKSGNTVAGERQSSFQKEVKMPCQGSRYNKLELDSALTVIKKVMKMEAAAPFNEPVNPEALGIPDYFDIIDTPMDFGTICNNLENGDKYMNSEDVFKDVQYVWDNCCKYNNKGDAILDLMRRVKKNFMKYWTAAGLYSEQSRRTNAAEGGEVEDAALSSQGKMQIKAGQSKMKNKKHGRRHKSDCLCAICVLKRRKREREANERMAKGQIGVQELQQEESSPVDSPYAEDSSLNMDELMDQDADAEVEGEGEKVKVEVSEQQYIHMEERHEEEDDEEEEEEEDEEENEIKTMNKGEGETKEQSQFADRLSEEHSRKSQPEAVDKSDAVAPTQKVSTLAQNEEESRAVQQQRHKESQERQQRAKMLESFCIENPILLNLCGILFPNNQKSVWSGPHSLVKNQVSRTSPIHAAIETFMK